MTMKMTHQLDAGLWFLLVATLFTTTDSLWAKGVYGLIFGVSALVLIWGGTKPSLTVVPDKSKINPDEFYPPIYGTKESCGLDLALQYPITIRPNSVTSIDFCFAAQVPVNHGGFILPRSSKGSKEGLGLRNTITLIDSDYTGNWKATITRDIWELISDEHFELLDRYKVQLANNEVEWRIPAGTYLFQVAILPYTKVDVKVDEDHVFEETERGSGGHGSTTQR